MPSYFTPTENQFRVLQGETKTAFYDKRFLAPGTSVEDVEPGELLGIRPQSGNRVVGQKITSASQAEEDAGAAIMRVDTTKYDSLESGAVTCLDGLYILETEIYLPGETYAAQDYLTLRYDSGFDGGVLGPLRANKSAESAIGLVQSPPSDSSNRSTPMRVKMFAQPLVVSTDGSGNVDG